MTTPPAPPRGVLHTRRRWRYRDALSWMAARHDEVVRGGPMHVAVAEHAPWVVTLGRHAALDEDVPGHAALADRGVEVVPTERGGGATAHGPGQIVVYPVIDMKRLGLTVRTLTALLEDVAIDVCAASGIQAGREPGAPGVYVRGRKVASVGFRSRRGVVTHGLSINVDNDVWPFEYIKVCRDPGRRVTTMKTSLELVEQDDDERARRFFDDQIDCTKKFFMDRVMLDWSTAQEPPDARTEAA